MGRPILSKHSRFGDLLLPEHLLHLLHHDGQLQEGLRRCQVQIAREHVSDDVVQQSLGAELMILGIVGERCGSGRQ